MVRLRRQCRLFHIGILAREEHDRLCDDRCARSDDGEVACRIGCPLVNQRPASRSQHLVVPGTPGFPAGTANPRTSNPSNTRYQDSLSCPSSGTGLPKLRRYDRRPRSTCTGDHPRTCGAVEPRGSTVALRSGCSPTGGSSPHSAGLGCRWCRGSVVSESMPVSLTATPWSPRQPCTAWRVARGPRCAQGLRRKGTPVVEDWRTAAAYGADNREKRGDALPVYAPDASSTTRRGAMPD